MNCLRCNLELFDEPDAGAWIDKVWGEACCYDASRQEHRTELPHLHARDLLDRAIRRLCDWVNAQSDFNPDDPSYYRPEYYEVQTIRHVDPDAGMILATLDPRDEGGPSNLTVYYDALFYLDTLAGEGSGFGELKMLVIDFDTMLTVLNYAGTDTQLINLEVS